MSSSSQNTSREWFIYSFDRRSGKIVGDGVNVRAGKYRVVEHEIVDSEAEKSRRYRQSKCFSQASGNGFVWLIYSPTEPYLDALSPGSLARLVYLSTYMCYDRRLSSGSKSSLSFNDLPALLNISQRMVYKFWDEIKPLHLLTSDSKGLSFNSHLFRKGKLSRQVVWNLYTQGKYAIRLNITAVRHLYRSVSARAHKQLGYIFRILPYVNREYNIACHNPLETEIDKICPMSAGDFCDAVGYDRLHAYQLLPSLLKLSLPGNQPLCNVIRQGKSERIGGIIISPYLYYAGQHESTVLNWLDEKR